MNPLEKNKKLNLWLIIGFLYCVLKMYRNSLNSAGSTTQGGIWNVINVAFVVSGLWLLLVYISGNKKTPKLVSIGFLYSFYAMTVSFFAPRSLSISTIFGYLMLFYFPSLVLVMFNASEKGMDKVGRAIYNVGFWIIAAFALYLMFARVALDNTEVYQSDAYFLLCLLPFVLLFDKGRSLLLKLIPIAIVAIFSGKRTGFFSLCGAVFIYYLIEYVRSKNFKMFAKMIVGITLSVVAFIILYNILDKRFNINLLERVEGLSQDGGSGREEIYTGIWNAYKNSDFLNKMIGHGIGGIQVVYGRNSGAHNDFLEILYNYGIFAVILFVCMYLTMIGTCIKMIKSKYQGAGAVGAVVVISILMSLFSNFFITFTQITLIGMFWGVALADWKKFEAEKLAQENK